MGIAEKSMIQVLDRQLVDLIAAGEVIDSPLAVVRELVENALDAGADRILVRVWWDQWRLEVLDNGQGMDVTELKTSVLPHATSKISTQADLQRIKTLGFRGEALHSLAQVARLTISSRSVASPGCGWRITYSPQGSPEQIEPVAIAMGTRVEVRQLFANFPQRRQAFAKSQQFWRPMVTYLQQLALCHPQVTWQLWQDERLRLSLSPGPNPEAILLQCLKSLQAGQLGYTQQSLSLPVDLENQATSAQLSLTFGYPDRCHRPRPDWLIIAINGRPVNVPELTQTILAVFHRTLPRQRYPLCFAHWQLPPQCIDWHRHPAKTEIYLQDLPHWQGQLKTLLHQSLAILGNDAPPRLNQLLKAAEPKGVYQLQGASSLTETVLGYPKAFKAIAQVCQTYVVVEHDQGIWLVEQHVAHERVLFEQLQRHWQCLPLEQPLVLQGFNPEQVERLQNLGLEIDPFGEDIWAVRSLPALLQGQEEIIAILRELSQVFSLSTAQAAIACRSAIKNGMELDRIAINKLIEQWQQCDNPHTCPHGRPIYLALDESSLARFFRRNWLVNPKTSGS
ncbi:DNA mismatch repair protein; MutL [Synechocystis sp. PCC 6803]|nr:DNA mismatch repair protein MutL [Synechocystis sp. PCC 6803]AVP91232.1 DNA mismatch repair endonuclease MutL [Synechocystis sp. IPPAS B-1465]MBD2618607.1 DNA mismatch repair endonuclease MutL [Synechocystis sp. FACHB-898]MBD2639958.1 DNA mismatch repair endonuclease MutL [Synechocystis sp. FACHB-908]MBD2661081.1 DNA mismatch repair endonuclease MutL [Synechocystis sp. FACHB-929]BAL28553.1 DNA mismatch repair protein [Synechocystis sp. PCC 6803 substr. GT-I]BAL31722.1 DNA mismatch repair p